MGGYLAENLPTILPQRPRPDWSAEEIHIRPLFNMYTQTDVGTTNRALLGRFLSFVNWFCDGLAFGEFFEKILVVSGTPCLVVLAWFAWYRIHNLSEPSG